MALSLGAAKGLVDLTHTMGFNMQGFAVPEQKATGIGMYLYSRAFTISSGNGHTHLAIAVVDVWACTESIKQEVIPRLHTKFRGGHGFFNAENVQVVGTHTHSGPAGISEYRLYNTSTGKFKKEIRDAYAEAIAESIFDAYNSRSHGEIRLHRVDIENCGRNRSVKAYLNNPEEERTRIRQGH